MAEYVDYVCGDCRALNVCRGVLAYAVGPTVLPAVYCAWCKRRGYLGTSVRKLEADDLADALNGGC